MKIPTAAMPAIRLATIMAFVAVCALIFGYLWLGAGGRLPLISDDGYRVSLAVPSVDNLVNGSDVTVAGVEVGTVVHITTRAGTPQVTMQLDPGHAPLHQGATVAVRNKTLLQETFLEVTDGDGKPLPNGARLPDGSATPSVGLNDVLASIDEPTRRNLAATLRSLGSGTKGTHDDIAAAVSGLGMLGRDGETTLDALAQQSDQLRRLAGNAATLLTALDTQQGRIAQLASDAESVTQATVDSKADIEAVMRKLPGLLDNARAASGSLTQLSGSLGPVAADLKVAAPDLTAALRELPETGADLRGLLPALDSVLGRAPATLERVPTVSDDARQLIPNVRLTLCDLNPMLAYLSPYGRDLSAWFASTADAMRGTVDGEGHTRFTVPQNDQSIRGIPGGTEHLLPRRNPYPGPGQAEHPVPFQGKYPRVTDCGR